MTLERHPDLDELIQYCLGTPPAGASGEAVRLHLAECSDCRATVEAIHADLALTAMSVPRVAPPAEAKARLFQAAGLDLAAAEKSSSSTRTIPIAPPVGRPALVPAQSRRSSPGLLWGGWVAAAACLFYAVQLRMTTHSLHQQLRAATAQILQADVSTARARQVLEVLSSSQAQRVTLVAAHATPEPTGHAVYLANRGALVFTASNLAPLPPNKTYELWVIPANGTAPVPAGTFQPDARGMASVLLPNLPKGVAAKAFGVTMENAGGSATPTLPILLAGG